MMVSEIARKYAQALFYTGFKVRKLDEFLVELRSFRDLLLSAEDFRTLFFNPTVTKKLKVSIIQQLELSREVKNFLNIIIGNRREKFIFSIISGFALLVNEDKGIEEGVIFVLNKEIIDAEVLDRIKSKLLDITGAKEIKLDIIEQSDLISGIRIRFAAKEIDLSYKTHLMRLKHLIRSGTENVEV